MGGASGTTPTTATSSAAGKGEASEQKETDRNLFMEKLRKFHENRGIHEFLHTHTHTHTHSLSLSV